MTAAVPPPHRTGEVIAGQFELLDLVGRGSTATVYRAWDRERGAIVALKVTSYEPGRDGAGLAARWQREAALLERLATPQVVRFYGLYYDEPSHSLALALDYIEGESLATRLAHSGPLPWPEATRIALEVGRALTYAHQWIVHRDVKPANILLGQDGRVSLTDFGIAKEVVTGETGSTIAGTSRYMAPEQRRGDTVDGRADTYGLGLVLAEMLLGHHPWETLFADSPEGMPPAAVTLPPVRAPPDAAARLQAAVARATAPDREARYGTMAEFVRDLEAVAALALASSRPIQHTEVEQRRRGWPPRWTLALGVGILVTALTWGLAAFVGRVRQAAVPTPTITATAVPPAPTPAPAAVAATPTPGFNPHDYVGQGDRYNCDAFQTQAQAQAVLRADPSDPNKLDKNKDGIACESNRGAQDRTPVPRE